jgi:hypothetical protein
MKKVIELLEQAKRSLDIKGLSESTQLGMVSEARHIIDRAEARIISRMYLRGETLEQYAKRNGGGSGHCRFLRSGRRSGTGQVLHDS